MSSSYTFVGSGTLSLGSYATIGTTEGFAFPFPERSIAYLKYKAAVGILTAICVKRVNIISEGGVMFPQYIDTFNGVHSKNDLLTKEEATAMALAYNEALEMSLFAKYVKYTT